MHPANGERALQAVIFDFDGVIANSEPLHLRAFQDVLDEDGLRLGAEDYYARYLGFDDAGVFEHVSRDQSLALDRAAVLALVARKEARMQALLGGNTVLFTGAADFVRRCAAEVPVAIASGAARHEIIEILSGASLADAFRVIVAAGDTPEGKPSPQPYRLAFERLQEAHGGRLEARRCVAIEDSHWGLTSARGAGLRCVGVTTSYGAEDLPDADLIVGGLERLTLNMLDELATSTS